MHFEVEQKFVLADRADLLARLASLAAVASGEHRQRDDYFNHPSRDFAQTDEALRIRSMAEANFVTYKGPRLSARAKTRRELELPLAPGAAAAESFAELLLALGFVKVASVQKVRRLFTLAWEERPCEIALDQVVDVGSFAEIELSADAADVGTVEESLPRLAARLGLDHVERRSYLELLLAAQITTERALQ